MQSKLSCQCEIDYHIYKMSYGSHKAKIYDRRTKEKEKGVKAFHHGRSPFTKEDIQRERSGEQGTTEEPENS